MTYVSPGRHDVRLQVQFAEENLAVAELVQKESLETVVPTEEMRTTCLDPCDASARASSWYFHPLKSTSMGKIATGIVALRKIGHIRANQWRSRRDDETVSTHHGCNEGAGIRHQQGCLQKHRRQHVPTSRGSS